MKTQLAILALAAGLLAGCNALPDAPPLPPGEATEQFLDIARPLATTFATAMVARDPRLAPVVCDVADGLGVAMQREELTAEMVDRFTEQLRERHPEIDAVAYAAVKSFLGGLYDVWRRRFGPVVIDERSGRVLNEIQTVLRRTCDVVRPPT